MSKEQTPITAEEWMKEKGMPENRTVANLAEQYANAKVLEALEGREHVDCGEDGVKTICPACKNVLWTTKQK
jgi:hypothetical protein